MSDERDDDDAWFKSAVDPSARIGTDPFPNGCAILDGCKRLRMLMIGKRDGKKIIRPPMDVKLFIEGDRLKVGFVDKPNKRTGYAWLDVSMNLESALESVLEALEVNWNDWGGKK